MKILLVESRILGFGIHNSAQGIQNPLTNGIQDAISTNKDWNAVPQSGIHGSESRIQDCLEFPVRGAKEGKLCWAWGTRSLPAWCDNMCVKYVRHVFAPKDFKLRQVHCFSSGRRNWKPMNL